MHIVLFFAVFFIMPMHVAWSFEDDTFLPSENTQQETVIEATDKKPKTFKQKTGPGIGAFIPHDLSSIDHNGKEQSLETLQGHHGITLMFVRSADWCPFCQQQLLDANEHAEEFEEAGYPLVTLSYDSSEVLKNFHQKYNLGFTMLSDKSSEIIKAFGLLNEEIDPESFSYGIAHPGVYIVDSQKVVLGKFFMGDYKERVSTEEILKSVKNIGHF